MILTLITILALALFLGARFEGSGRSIDDSYNIRFGIVELDAEGRYRIAVETTTIPFFTSDTGFAWGYVIQPPEGAAYTTYEILYLPSPPLHIRFSVPIDRKDGGRIIQTAAVTRSDETLSFFSFDPGDPAGLWRLSIYINDRLARSVRFSVVPPR